MGPVPVQESSKEQRKRNLIDNTLDDVRTLDVGKSIEIGPTSICRALQGGYSITHTAGGITVPTLGEARRVLQGLLNCAE